MVNSAKWVLFSVSAVAATVLAMAACGGGGGGSKAVADVHTQLEEELAAEKSGNADAYLKHVTDNWLKTVAGVTRDEAKKDPSSFQNDNQPEIGKITVKGKKATVEAIFDLQGFDYRNSADLVKEGNDWKLDVFHVLSAEKLPAGAKKVNLDLTDLAFGFTRKDVTSKDQLVFHVENKGKQSHMIILTKVDPKADLQKLLASGGAGAEDVGAAYEFAAGDKADIVLKEKLKAGRYLMLCFVADEEDPKHTPHALKGMVADFTVE